MVDETHGSSMTDAEIAEFLSDKGDGVLSFAGTPTYAIPVSFGYDGANRRLVFQFVFSEDSRKRTYVERDEDAMLVAYEWNHPNDWRSVVSTGRLRPIERDTASATTAAEVFAEHAKPVGLEVFDRTTSDLEPEWYGFEWREMRGRRSAVAAD
jgi:hypothetical protein